MILLPENISGYNEKQRVAVGIARIKFQALHEEPKFQMLRNTNIMSLVPLCEERIICNKGVDLELNDSQKLEFRLPNFWDVARTVCGRSSGRPTPKLGVGTPKPSKGLGVVPPQKK
ncbi:uncharacterized protein PGTG_14240 [Puccinia graminis f. sp. tritici CRL 75-36-700-3]|uniref:Uncharacterized protein n=1 Tax=Puccinia graminis f. sp. tritici (strain CRL 75-36-700-3 / race SCCL) TaxID=418459 RepID=E3KX08_PUCGT|nr:uncharacterized protein PGTG_14240 [Puccinia graminis f. sp. tritici CRL 75-36-700-3]EFP88901.1 hypothetical protein PGTG_14240 [Puccinia graminis f. sp. tritici CRL 75-36-700-3]